jgi:hypothetical protein
VRLIEIYVKGMRFIEFFTSSSSSWLPKLEMFYNQEVTKPESQGIKICGKGKRSAEIEETEQVLVYDPPVGSPGPLLE